MDKHPAAVSPPPLLPPSSDPHAPHLLHDHPPDWTLSESPGQPPIDDELHRTSSGVNAHASQGLLSDFVNPSAPRHKKGLSRRAQQAIALLTFIFVVALCVKLLTRHPPAPTHSRPRPPAHGALGNPQFALHNRKLPCTTWPVRRENNTFVLDGSTDLRGFHGLHGQHSPLINDTYGALDFTKPKHTRIIAVVFFGRREYVDILDCYLKRNLVSNGGIVDEVQFLVNTKNHEDIAWLDRLIAQEGAYSRHAVDQSCKGRPHDFSCLWTGMTADSTLYIKLDDDILFMHENAIPQLVQARIDNPHAIAVGGALVNSHLLSWPVYHNGAVHPYLPEPADLPKADPPITWRTSELPPYPKDKIHKHPTFRNGQEPRKFSPQIPNPPFEGHRWLQLPYQTLILETPIYEVDHSNLNIAQRSWMVAAQQHYSFFQNLEKGTLSKYDVGDDRGIWDPQYRRYNLNFAAFWGTDVKKHSPVPKDDEGYFTVKLPQKVGRPFLVATRALVSHFHFGPQAAGVRSTDLLDRYRAYANEFVCPSDSPRMPMAGPCAR